MDFAGPLFIKTGTRNHSSTEKVYIALFTCGSSRAVHMELVPHLIGGTSNALSTSSVEEGYLS